MLIGSLPFVLLEVGLVALDVGDPLAYKDPFVGFGETHPLFALDEEEGVYRTLRTRRPYFGEQQFAAVKPKNGYRVFCLGGSTVRGRPFETETSFCNWLKLEFELRDPTKHYEFINAGGVSYASYRLGLVLDEVLDYAPDLIVLATGHNEFLEDRTYEIIKSRNDVQNLIAGWLFSLRTVTLVRQMLESAEKSMMKKEVTARLDDEFGYESYQRDDEWRKNVVTHFGQAVQSMVDMAKRERIPMVLVGLGANLRDCPPFKSEHRPGLSESMLTAWNHAFRAARMLENSDPQRAIEFYKKAEHIDGEHALLNYRMARTLDRIGQVDESRSYYIKAKEWDVCPLRMLENMYAQLRTTASKNNILFVDARNVLGRRNKDGLPGSAIYVDHVHPSIHGHLLISRAIVTELEHAGLIDRTNRFSANEQRQAYNDFVASLPDYYLPAGQLRLAKLERWARRQLLYEEGAPRVSEEMLRYGQQFLAMGDSERAFNYFKKAVEQNDVSECRIRQRLGRLLELGQQQAVRKIRSRLVQENLLGAEGVYSC
jgi:tetratricopeptide (TPR) repeat protein